MSDLVFFWNFLKLIYVFVFIPDGHGGDAVAHPVPYPEPVDEPGVVRVQAPGVDGAAGVPAHEDAGAAQAGARHVRDGGHVLAVPGQYSTVQYSTVQYTTCWRYLATSWQL